MWKLSYLKMLNLYLSIVMEFQKLHFILRPLVGAPAVLIWHVYRL